jgi:hypothetical protein
MQNRRTGGTTWHVAVAVAAGLAVAALILVAALSARPALFSEASAERGRDCATVASARHGLEAGVEAALRADTAPSAQTVTLIHAATNRFRAATDDLATKAVVDAMTPIHVRVDGLDAAVAPVSTPAADLDPEAVRESTATRVRLAADDLRLQWDGRLGQICGWPTTSPTP